MSEVVYPDIPPQFIDGEKAIRNEDGETIAIVSQFWQWAFSDLIGNTERGALAEYLIACALGIQKKPRITWDSYDLKSPEGISIEVKSAAYIQTWGQSKLSDIVFNIRPTHSWNPQTNTFDAQKRRQSDIYVFCLHNHKVQETIDITDIKQWTFYLLPTCILNEKAPQQKTINLSSLLKLGAVPCTFSKMHEKIVELCS